jgi:nucleoid-associated protein YgaU
VAIKKAGQRKNLWRDTTDILEQADSAMTAGEYRKARDLAISAREQAEAAETQSYRADAGFLIALLRKDYMDKMYTDQKDRLESAARALDEGRAQEAYDTASLIMAELKAQMADHEPSPAVVMAEEAVPEPSPVATLSTYTVNRKDNLWDIAAKAEVYGNADMWPLLWRANQAKIKRPDNLAIGITLVVDRNASAQSVAAAIKHSRLRGAPSLGPVDAFDQQYLKK